MKLEESDLRSSLWILPYLSGLIGMSYLGAFGGINVIPFGWDFIVIAGFSVIIFQLAVKSRSSVCDAQVDRLLLAEAQMHSAS